MKRGTDLEMISEMLPTPQRVCSGGWEQGVAAGLTLFSDTGQGRPSSAFSISGLILAPAALPWAAEAHRPRVSSSAQDPWELPQGRAGRGPVRSGVSRFFSPYKGLLCREPRPLRNVGSQLNFD